MHAFQAACRETGAYPPGITQAVLVIDGQQQRAEPAAAALGLAVADDHELLAQPAFELDPVEAAP
ncbi:hypothetical protein D3C77_737100 [compost metagenome]